MKPLNAFKPMLLAIGLALVAIPAAAAPQHGRDGGHRAEGRAVPRGEVRAAPRVTVSPRVVRPGVVVRPYSYYRPYYRPYFYRPYYTFRPRWNVGFGLWVGYPIAYPAYAYSYPYPPEAPYPYPNAGPVTVAPGSAAAAGGLSFEIEPSSAEVYVDGQYVGLSGDFAPTMQPLSLAPGRHHVEIRLAGYQPMSFDTDVMAGQVIPYQGTMQPE